MIGCGYMIRIFLFFKGTKSIKMVQLRNLVSCNYKNLLAFGIEYSKEMKSTMKDELVQY